MKQIPASTGHVLGRSAVTTALILACLAAVLAASRTLGRLDNAVYDLALRSVERPAPDDIVIVAVDEASIDRFGRWPWSRGTHARLIDELAKAKVRAIGFDVIFAEADSRQPGEDEKLIGAVRSARNVVLPILIEQRRVRATSLEAPPFPPLARVAARLGHIHVEFDSDGMARSAYAFEGVGNARWPHFALALLMHTDPDAARRYQPPAAIEPDPFVIRRADRMLIPYLGPPGHFRRVSYADVIEGKVSGDALRDRIVLVGATASGLGDQIPTPFSDDSQLMSGVEFNANVLEALRRGTIIREFPGAGKVLLSAMLAALPLLLLPRLATAGGLIVSVGTAAGAVLLSIVGAMFAQFWFPPAAAAFVALLAYPVWSWRRLDLAATYMDSELEAASAALKDDPVFATRGENRVHDAFEARLARLREMSERLRELRSAIDHTVNAMPHGVIAAGADDRVLLANAKAAEAVGAKRAEELSNRTVTSVLDDLQVGLSRPSPAERHWRGQALSSRGEELLIESVAPAEEVITSVKRILSLVDVSASRKLESQRRDMLAFLSHDLRAPLSAALAAIDNAMMASVSPGKSDLPRIREQVARSLALADGFLLVARAEMVTPSELRPVDLAAVVHSAVDYAYPSSLARSIMLERNVPAGPVWVRGSTGLLERAVSNLIDNAVRHAPPGTPVRVDLTIRHPLAQVGVVDTGPGLDAERIADILQRSARPGHVTRSGTGLGLYFVQIVAKQLGGSLSIHSAPRVATRFEINLPTDPATDEP